MSPRYEENGGGSIALHRLCHIINEYTEHKAYLCPLSYSFKNTVKEFLRRKKKFLVNDSWNTPIYRSLFLPKNEIVIYPEIVSGNPLKSKRVIRWFLHNPGHFTGEINYGDGELYFKYTSGFDKYIPNNNSCISPNLLTVVSYPTDIYMENTAIQKDIDTSYIVRKGKGKPFIHPPNSICIDELPHTEVANILKRSKNFISYDLYTAYSRFATLAGCDSYVVPAENLSLESWLPDEADRYGVAYGFSDSQLKWAKSTKSDLIRQVERQNTDAVNSVKACLKDIENYFQV